MPRHVVAERFEQHFVLLLLGDFRRLEEMPDARILAHARCDVANHLAPATRVLGATRELEQRLGVVPGDRRLAHQLLIFAAGIEERKLSTMRRLESSSRFFSITFDAPAIARSTASLRSSAIAFVFSLSISRRARSSMSCCCTRVSSIMS